MEAFKTDQRLDNLHCSVELALKRKTQAVYELTQSVYHISDAYSPLLNLKFVLDGGNE